MNYSTIFNESKEGNIQNDELFYEKFENLQVAKVKKSSSQTNSDSISSVKDDFYLNKDVLNMLNSSGLSKLQKKISSDSISLSSISANDGKKSEGIIYLI
jgi:hypothetical protein